MRRYSYPYTIENGAGERLTFLRRIPGSTGDRLEAENIAKPGAGPPMHVHYHQEEVFTVQEGRIGYQRAGEPEQFAGPGVTVAFKPGEAHRFWNAGEGDLRCTGHVEPADNVEYLLSELFESMRRSGGVRPDPFDIAFLMARYRGEFGMLEIPTAVQRVVFPVLVAVGRLLRRYKKYSDAPEPVRRSGRGRFAVLAAVVMLAVQVMAGVAHGQASEHSPSAGGRTRVVILGSGTPAADPERSGPAVVILVDSSAYLFDIGVGVVRRWAAALGRGVAELDESALRLAFVTHLHSDHTLGYPELIFTSWTLGQAARPLDVYGPEGLADMTTHILAAYKQDIAIRTGAGGEKAGAAPPVVRVHEIEPGVVYADSLVSVTAFPVRHGTWAQAFGYRIQTPDKVIVLSGDAAASSGVAEQCRGCDLLLHEGGFVGEADARDYFRKFHTTAEELAQIAEEAAPGLLILYHQRSAGRSTGKGYRTLRSRYSGAFVVARDLDVFY